MFTLSQFTNDYYKKLFKKTKNICVTGNLVRFLKLVKRGHYKIKINKKNSIIS